MKLSENGMQKKNGELIVNITEFGLFSGTYDSIWITDDHYESEYDYIMELYENKDEDPLPKKILEIENITKDDIEIEVNSKPFLKAIGEVYCVSSKILLVVTGNTIVTHHQDIIIIQLIKYILNV